MASHNQKLRMRPHSMRLLADIDRYIKQYDIKGDVALSQSASDELDGAVTRDEVDDLVRRRLLSIVRLDKGNSELCGGAWTVALTDRALMVLWPDRVN